ncbi:hypothetical protein SAMN05444362_11237 [Dysgonomonas macrotermitis]|uniref:Amidohydrolase-related domain-containing protein n=2 Tax=Dysgonomonas macrotermitis TaxID=1346286 RepID=A0A1M5FLL3_9BACT|nr:hypothetical protein SAMN05444362_11237 [Dysgonomonas macrotermitis]
MIMHKIIDFHSHLGDIFMYRKNVIYDPCTKLPAGSYDPFDQHALDRFEGPFLDPNKPEEVKNVIDMTALVSWTCTLERLTRHLDASNITNVCMYPVAPNIFFEDYLAASKIETRIIPFTCIDPRLSPEQVGEQVLRDYHRGAKGLKIHPILQKLSLSDARVIAALEAWEQTGLCVVSHTGINSYYPPALSVDNEVPENGDVKYFIELAKKFPKIPMVAAHAGGLTGGEEDILSEGMKGYDNLWVDTTFRSVDGMKKLVKVFGEDRVLFGVDRPFSRTDTSVEICFEAFGQWTALSEKIMYTNAAKIMQMI